MSIGIGSSHYEDWEDRGKPDPYPTWKQLGYWNIVRDYNPEGFALYDPAVEGDALYIKFDTFAALVTYLQMQEQIANMVCPTCRSKGFPVSSRDKQKCEFCDNPEGTDIL